VEHEWSQRSRLPRAHLSTRLREVKDARSTGARKRLVSPRGPQTSAGHGVLLSAAFDWPPVSRYAASSTPLQH